MKKSHNKGSRRQLIPVVIFPLIALFWMVGWVLSWIGSKKIAKNHARVKPTRA